LFTNKKIETVNGHFAVAKLARSFVPYLIAIRNTEKYVAYFAQFQPGR